MRYLCFNCPYNKGLELSNGCGNDTCIQENMLFEKDEEPVEISYWRVVMEEKERYVYHEVSNEVEQYECYYDTEKCCELFDNEDILNRLNKQDKRIKELEEELDDAKRDYIPKLEFGLQRANKMGRDAKKENQQLKQQLHDLPKKIVEEIKEWIKSQIIYCGGKANEVDILIANASNQVLEDLQNILDTILKKYGGESEQ